jgi:hypothetical protein
MILHKLGLSQVVDTIRDQMKAFYDEYGMSYKKRNALYPSGDITLGNLH